MDPAVISRTEVWKFQSATPTEKKGGEQKKLTYPLTVKLNLWVDDFPAKSRERGYVS